MYSVSLTKTVFGDVEQLVVQRDKSGRHETATAALKRGIELLNEDAPSGTFLSLTAFNTNPDDDLSTTPRMKELHERLKAYG